MSAARVLVVLNTAAAWSRGILRGFSAVAHERGWQLLHYHPGTNLDWLVHEWAPDVALLGPELRLEPLARLPRCPIVSVNADRSAEQVASACLDEDTIGDLAAAHLIARGFRHVTAFRFDDAPFAVQRERAFASRAAAERAQLAAGWWVDGAEPPRNIEDAAALIGWLRGLPKPCGIFTCTDAWGRVVARYARAAGLHIPADLALVGVDNDTLECELIAPPLSSVAVPWRNLGREAASLVQLALSGRAIAGKRRVVAPIDVVARRSSDALSIADPLVSEAAAWIRSNAGRRLTVPLVARAVSSSRHRLERSFRTALARTVQEEIRRAHVELAKQLLSTTRANMKEIAKQSGFTSAALLSVAFQRELGMPPGAYRRRMTAASDRADD